MSDRTYVTVLRGPSPREARTIFASADEAVVEATLQAIRERTGLDRASAAASNAAVLRDGGESEPPQGAR